MPDSRVWDGRIASVVQQMSARAAADNAFITKRHYQIRLWCSVAAAHWAAQQLTFRLHRPTASQLATARRRVHDRRRRASPEHPALRARRTREGRVLWEQLHGGRLTPSRALRHGTLPKTSPTGAVPAQQLRAVLARRADVDVQSGCLGCAGEGSHSPAKTRHTPEARTNSPTATKNCGHSVHKSPTNRKTKPSAAGPTASHLRFRMCLPLCR